MTTQDDAARIRALVVQTFIEPFEGFSPTPYRDTAGTWTIGYGTTRDAAGNPVTETTPPITRDQALDLAERDLRTAQNVVNAAVTVPLTTNQTAALIDFVYNLGAGNFRRSTLLRRLNERDYAAAAAQFPLWDEAGGIPLPGLRRRREAEARLFLSDGPATA